MGDKPNAMQKGARQLLLIMVIPGILLLGSCVALLASL